MKNLPKRKLRLQAIAEAILLFLTFEPSFANPTNELESFIKMALEKDKGLEMLDYQIKSQDQLYKQTRKNFYPRIAASSAILDNSKFNDYSNQKNLTVGLSISQRLYDAEVRKRIEIQNIDSQQTMENKKQREHDLMLIVAKLYCEIIRAKQELSLANESLNLARNRVQDFQKMKSLGAATGLTVLEAETRTSEKKIEIVKFQYKLNSLQQELRTITGMAEANVQNNEFPVVAFSQNYLKTNRDVLQASSSKPDLQVLKKQIEIAQLERDEAKSRGQPKINLFLKSEKSHNFLENSNKSPIGLQLGVELNWIIYGSEISNEAISSRIFEEKRARTEYEAKLQELGFTLDKIESNKSYAEAVLKSFSEQINELNRLLSSHEQGIRLGVLVTSNLFEVEDRIYRTKLAIIDANAKIKSEELEKFWSLGLLPQTLLNQKTSIRGDRKQ